MLESPHLRSRVMPQNNEIRNKSESFLKVWQIGILTTVPFILVAGPVLGYLAGNWVDQKYHSDPYAKAVLIIVGLIASVREIVRIIRDVIRT